eukprot:6407071-Pyramimonas_sp.AAC.2
MSHEMLSCSSCTLWAQQKRFETGQVTVLSSTDHICHLEDNTCNHGAPCPAANAQRSLKRSNPALVAPLCA